MAKKTARKQDARSIRSRSLRLTRRAAAITLLSGLGASSMLALPALVTESRLKQGSRWTAFYGHDVDPAAFAGFDLVVLDPNYAQPISSVRTEDMTVLSYLSLGEMNRHKPEFAAVQASGGLVQQNPTWPDSYSVDVRNHAWRDLIVDTIIPSLIAQGFDGLFLDTLDSPPHLEMVDPVRYAGMTTAAVALVRAIRERYPDMPLMMNRGYALLPRLVGTIDAVVAESMLTSFEADTHSYHVVDDAMLARHLEFLRPARDAGRRLPIFSLDYWDPEDADTIARIYARERELGHSPYVGTVLLDVVMPEPTAAGDKGGISG